MRARGVPRRLQLTLDDARRRYARGASRLILLDLDGTLADFRIDPEKVELHPGIRDTLEALLSAPRTRVVVVTGRRAAQAHRIVGLDPIDVVGMHGREVYSHGRVRTRPAPARARRALDRLLTTARELARGVNGAVVEDKRPGGVVLHVRGAAPIAGRRAERAFVREILQARAEGIEWMTGKRMAEARVAGVDKGDACARLARAAVARARTRRPVIFFAGDDVTDEHAHSALRRFGAITVVVAPGSRKSAARFRVHSIAEMKAVLDVLARPLASHDEES